MKKRPTEVDSPIDLCDEVIATLGAIEAVLALLPAPKAGEPIRHGRNAGGIFALCMAPSYFAPLPAARRFDAVNAVAGYFLERHRRRGRSATFTKVG